MLAVVEMIKLLPQHVCAWLPLLCFMLQIADAVESALSRLSDAESSTAGYRAVDEEVLDRALTALSDGSTAGDVDAALDRLSVVSHSPLSLAFLGGESPCDESGHAVADGPGPGDLQVALVNNSVGADGAFPLAIPFTSSPTLELAHLARLMDTADIDNPLHDLASGILNTQTVMLNDSASQQLLGCSRTGQRSVRNRVVSLGLEYEDLSWSDMIGRIVRAGGADGSVKLHQSIEVSIYDGVDVRCNTTEELSIKVAALDAPVSLAAVADAPPSDAIVELDGSELGVAVPIPDPVMKTSERAEAFRVVAFSYGGTLSIILGHRTVLLQHSDRTTGEAMATLLRQQGIDEQRSNWDRHGRCTCTDRYAPNYIGETECIGDSGGYGFHPHCEGHMCATGLTSQRSLIPDTKAGMSAYPKAMRQKGEMDLLRECFCIAIWNKLRVATAVLSRSAARFKEMVFQCCIPGDMCLQHMLSKLARVTGGTTTSSFPHLATPQAS